LESHGDGFWGWFGGGCDCQVGTGQVLREEWFNSECSS
jgi:hypothetical protein